MSTQKTALDPKINSEQALAEPISQAIARLKTEREKLEASTGGRLPMMTLASAYTAAQQSDEAEAGD